MDEIEAGTTPDQQAERVGFWDQKKSKDGPAFLSSSSSSSSSPLPSPLSPITYRILLFHHPASGKTTLSSFLLFFVSSFYSFF
ncbi:hypothetical protein CTA2_12152 [Colletotrichum tanaceti]|nr:hypothetical protein CTA2_12152 [Colletotrichum tanaceti]